VAERLATSSWTVPAFEVPEGSAAARDRGLDTDPTEAVRIAPGDPDLDVVSQRRGEMGTGVTTEVLTGAHPVGPEPRGSAPVALLIHGVTSSSRTWWRVGPALAARGYRVLAVDLRGHGASPGVGGALALADLSADVLQTLHDDGSVAMDGIRPSSTTDRIGPFSTSDGGLARRVASPPIDLVVGHSLGALVAMDLLGRVPGLARRLVLEEPPGPTTADWAAMADGIEADTRRARTDPDRMRRDMVAENPGWASEEVDRRLDDLAACDAGGIAAALRGTVAFDASGLAAAVDLPTLLVVGLEDLGSALAGPDRAAMISALAGRGTIQVLDSGHNLHREAFERYMEVLDRWLEGTAHRPEG
jgi:pimeloyl-ACP methyl ester carboxylesterase